MGGLEPFVGKSEGIWGLCEALRGFFEGLGAFFLGGLNGLRGFRGSERPEGSFEGFGSVFREI